MSWIPVSKTPWLASSLSTAVTHWKPQVPILKWDTFQKKLMGNTGLGFEKGLVTGVKTQVSDRTWPKGRKTCLCGQLKTVVLKCHLGQQQFYSQGYLVGPHPVLPGRLYIGNLKVHMEFSYQWVDFLKPIFRTFWIVLSPWPPCKAPTSSIPVSPDSCVWISYSTRISQ